MAFVPPMVSASPPPMSPDDTLEDISAAMDEDAMVEEEDEDDLTGLSGKLHSIPVEAMRAPPPPSPKNGPSHVENEETASKDDFCDFESAFPETEGADDSWAKEEPPAQISEEEDEFGDFGEAKSDFESVDHIQEFILKLEGETEAVIGLLFDTSQTLGDGCVESQKPYSLESIKGQDMEIWPKISDVGATPSLSFTWKRSHCGDKLYNFLNIDKSVAKENSQRLQSVPAFASGLTTARMLEPMPITSSKPAESEPNHHPNDHNGDEVGAPDPDPSINAQILSDLSEERRELGKKPDLSQEAKAIVDAFPLLDFMRSPVLMFPVKASDGGDPRM